MNNKCEGKTHRAGLLALAIIGAAFSYGPVLAGEGRCHDKGHGAHHEMTAEQRTAHKAERLAELRTALTLTSAQEPAWQQYVAQLEQPRPAHPARDAMAKLTAPERLEHMLERMTTHQDYLKGRLAAVKTFYATLSPAQQMTFDERFKTWRGGHKAKS